jgi:hypothetical protein
MQHRPTTSTAQGAPIGQADASVRAQPLAVATRARGNLVAVDRRVIVGGLVGMVTGRHPVPNVGEDVMRPAAA